MANESGALTLISGASKPWIERLAEREMIDAMKMTIAKGASDAQFLIFVEVAKATNLNPFLNEIWWIPANGGKVMIAEDGWQKIANQNPHFKGYETFFDYEGDARSSHPLSKTLIGCEVRIYRDDREHPIVGYALWSEYGKSVGESAAWKYRHAMMENRAFCNAARKAFCVSGVYTPDEIPETQTAEVVETKPLDQASQMQKRFGVDVKPVATEPPATMENDSKVQVSNETLTAEQEIAKRMSLLFPNDRAAAQAWLKKETGGKIIGQTSLVKNPDLVPAILEKLRGLCEERGIFLLDEEPNSQPAPEPAPNAPTLTTAKAEPKELNEQQGEMLNEISEAVNMLAKNNARKIAYYIRAWTDQKVGSIVDLSKHPELFDTALDRARISLDEARGAIA